MSRVNIMIDGIAIKPPLQADFKESTYLVTDMIRNARGDMNGQILGIKHKLFFKYPTISGKDLSVIYNILQSNSKLFHRVWYTLDGLSFTRTMYVGEMPRTLLRTGRGIGDSSTWIWKDVNFNLIER